MFWPLRKAQGYLVATRSVGGDQIMGMRSLGTENSKPVRKANIWPVYDAPRIVPANDQSENVIDDMVSVLSGHEHGSTSEALAFLRQLYPRYPLTLRLAAIVAHSKAHPVQFALERPVAQ